MLRKLILSIIAAVGLSVLSGAVKADPVVFYAASGNPAVTGRVSGYSLSAPNSSGLQTFIFTVTNTSASGSITGIGFDLPGTNRGHYTLNSATTTDPVFAMYIADNVRVQAGAEAYESRFDFALLTGNNYGGGNVARGVGAGYSATFSITGNFSGLTAQQVAQSMSLRFQGVGPQDLSYSAEPTNPSPQTPNSTNTQMSTSAVSSDSSTVSPSASSYRYTSVEAY